MREQAEHAGNAWSRPSGHHGGALAVALLLSLGAHWAAWVRPPELPIGALARVRSEARFPSLRLREVAPLAQAPARRPARFRAEDPGRHMKAAEFFSDWTKALGETLPPSPDLSDVSLAGEAGAVAAPATPAARERWEPRQEILQVEDRLFSEEISALPRQYLPRVPRVPRAADWAPPAMGDVVARAVAGLPVQAVPVEAGAALRQVPTPPPEVQAVRLSPAAMETERLTEESAILDEKHDEVTTAQPVEQMLAIEVRTWQPPEEPDYAYFELRIRREGEDLLPVLPKDLLLIQDCSESMTQSKLNRCKEGLRRWIRRLDPADRFDLLTFRDTSERLFHRWTRPTALTLSIAEAYLERLVSRGKTDVYGSLEQVLTLERDPARPVIAVLITDGRPTMGMVDSSDIIEAFTRANAGALSMFCVGGGTRVNRFLLDLLGYKNRGDSLVVEDSARIPWAIEDLAHQVGRPVLMDLSYRFAGIPTDTIFPRTLTHLYLDRPLVLYGRVPIGQPRVVFQIIGRGLDRQADMVFEWDWNQVREGTDFIRTQWAWQRIYYLIGEHVRNPRPELLREIHSFAIRHGLIVPYGTDIPTR